MQLHTGHGALMFGVCLSFKQQQGRNVNNVSNFLLPPAHFVHSSTQRISVFSAWARTHPSPSAQLQDDFFFSP